MDIKYINRIERKAIYYNLIPVFLMGLSGLYFGIVGHSSAVVLDGLFSTVLFITVVIATYVGKIASKPRNKVYPQGHWLLENLYVLFKILVLMAIVTYSFLEATLGLIEYFNGTLEIQDVNTVIINYYYIIKSILVIFCFSVYSYYINKVKGNSDLLKVERQSVAIDGGITISIALGFLILSQFEQTKEISDQIILSLLSAFLFYIVFKEFIHELNKTLGKRTLQHREQFYLHYFNIYLKDITVSDVYIHFSGKVAIVSVTAQFDGLKSIDDITCMEYQIKQIMKKEFDDIFLYTYWERKDTCKI